MDKFPLPIANGMRHSGAMTSCVPVQIDHGIWESAVFFEVGGAQCKIDRNILRNTAQPLPVSVEGDLINHANGSVVMLRFEVVTNADDPLVGEVLLVPGLGDTQFETLKHLTEQKQLRWYFGDADYKVIHSQQFTIHDHEHQGYAALLDDALKRDALLRLTGKYHAQSAIDEVCQHYAFRHDH